MRSRKPASLSMVAIDIDGFNEAGSVRSRKRPDTRDRADSLIASMRPAL